MFNFVNYLLQVTENTESPQEYWRWAALSCLSVILRDNVYVENPILGKVYPNMYIILYGGSGIRKGAPCQFVGKLISSIGNTKFINGRSSMQAVVKELGMSYTTGNGHMISGASGVMYSEELSSFAVSDPATIPLMVDLYDYHETWKSNLVSWSSQLKNVCVSMLAGSNSDMFRAVYGEFAIRGGLLGRTLLINAEKSRKRISLFDMQNKGLYDLNPLVNHLRELTKVKGKIEANEDAIKEYNSWYYSIPEEVMNDRIGFGLRLGTHVLKIAIALSSARAGFDKRIEKCDIEEAIGLSSEVKKCYRSIIAGIGYSSESYQTSLVTLAIIKSPGNHITRKNLCQRLLGDVELDKLDKILNFLVQSGFVMELSKGNEPGYKITSEGINVLVHGRDLND